MSAAEGHPVPAPHWFGLPAPETAKVAWGARAIYKGLDDVDIVWDRQQMTEAPERDRKRLAAWVNDHGLKKLKKHLLKKGLYTDSDEVVSICQRGYTMRANPCSSHGYLYIVAWRNMTAAEMDKARTSNASKERT